MDEDCRGPLALALVANVATNLDFRDAKMLASTCSHVRSAVRAGPIGLVTDVERRITHEDLASLFGFLRWCGEAVRELRLEQQPRALWELPTMMEDEEPLLFWGARRNAEDAIRKQMPTNHSILLHRLAERCPRLHTLSIQGFDHPHCDLSDQDNWRSAISTLLPDALPCLRRLHLASAFQFDGSRTRNQTPLVLVPLLERTRIDQLDMTLGAVTTAGLLTAAAESSRRLLQISVSDLAPASVLLLCEVCTGLRRLRLTRCDIGVEQRAAHEPLSSAVLQALPRALSVLEMIECEATWTGWNSDVRSSFPLDLRLPELHHLELQLNSSDCGPRVSFGSAGEHLTPLASLRTLDVCGHALFGDGELLTVARCCGRLQWLAVAHTCVTSRGFRALYMEPYEEALGNDGSAPLPLPRLRVCLYANLMFESGLEDFLIPGTTLAALEEKQSLALADEAEKDLIIEQAGDLIASHAEADECIRAFFAFCALAVRRELVVPFEGNAETWRRTRPYTLPSCFALDSGGSGCLA